MNAINYLFIRISLATPHQGLKTNLIAENLRASHQ